MRGGLALLSILVLQGCSGPPTQLYAVTSWSGTGCSSGAGRREFSLRYSADWGGSGIAAGEP